MDYLNKNIEKNCPECNQKIIGRSDKKFCSDQCRSSHYHKRHGINTTSVKKINSILKKNRQILESLVLNNKIRVSKLALTSEGFNFCYFTHYGKKRRSCTPVFCYEFGYMDADGMLLTICQEDR